MTRQPPLRRVRYTDPEWRVIARAVRALNLDADTTTVADPKYEIPFIDDAYRQLGGDEPSSGLDLPHGRVMLRIALQRVLAVATTPTPDLPPVLRGPDYSRRVKDARRLQRKTDELIQIYTEYSKTHSWDTPPPLLSEAVLKLKEVSRRAVNTIKILGPDSSANAARSARNFMAEEILGIWTGLGGKSTGGVTEDFLAACLKPAFPDTTIHEVRRWLEERVRRSRALLKQVSPQTSG